MVKANILVGVVEMADFLRIGIIAMKKILADRELNVCPVHFYKNAWRADPAKLEEWYKAHLEAETARRHPELRRHMSGE